ncbi:hypothetical protein QBC46DRAFT_364132 [Diplogelasinospora grovesii]|uniref:DNA ligase n=1 Tax=Diplogelasinospora grovesii TaxID=303347 RepID=A0AAN6N8X3_9PEZI|nr:hypothetical protein QBC46DRAFT_364132 [Diplogelasinospora grovesii]
MATTGRTNVNRPVDIKQKEADVNRKLQIYGIISAFQNGKVPSNDQIDVALNSFLESKALSNPSEKLSSEGQALVGDVREVVEQAKNLLLSKNEGNLLQDFIWQTQQFDPKAVNVPGAPIDKDTAQQHGNQALEGLRTLGTLIITNGQFRKLLQDATVLFRDMAGDAASHAAARVRPSHEDLAQIDRPADNNTWHDAPDFSKDNMKQQFNSLYKGNPKEDAKGTLAQATQAAHPSGYSDPRDLASTAAHDRQTGQSSGVDAQAGISAAVNTAQKKADANMDDDAKETARAKKEEYRNRTKDYLKKKMPQERRDQTIWRLKKMVIECQQHPEYQRAMQTLLDLAEEYGSHANSLARGGQGTVKDTRVGLAQAEGDLKTLIERFANGTSTDDLWDSINTIYGDADRDEELRNWFKAMNRYIRRCLQEEGYILDDASTDEWNRLYDHGNYLLRNKYRGHTDRVVDEIKFLADQFDQDPQNKAFANAMTKLFTDLGNDENGKPTFKPHLVKDLTEVIIPAIFESVAYIPVPRIEYTDHQIDAVVENLVLESDNFMPNVLEIASENYMRFGRKKVANKSKHAIDVKVAGIQMDLRDVSYYVKRKEGFPSITDTGVANFLLEGDGFTFRMKLSTADEHDKQNFFKVDKVDVDVKNLKIKLIKSNHKLLFNLVKPILLKVMRPVLQKVLEKLIRDRVNQLDRMVYQVKQEADRSVQEAAENPENAPNIYSRYVQAAQKQILQGKQKAQDVAADKKVNYAVTKEDSIFPNIHLPGGISSKATEYKELARKGDKWESPVFSIGTASKSRDIPAAPRVTRKSHDRAQPNSVSNGSGYSIGNSYTNGNSHLGVNGRQQGMNVSTYSNGDGYGTQKVNPSVIPSGPFPRRPRNRSRTFLFSELYRSLFNPLLECKPSTGGAPAVAAKRRTGRGNPGSSKVSYHEQRRHIIERFMSRWRADVGLDFYPAMRLILPDKDRDRGVYGLKENTIGKLLVKVMKIDRHSEDGYGLMHWKLPGHGRGGGGGGGGGGRSSAGDFAGRVLEVVGKREMRTEPGELTIGDVNVLLDRLAAASGEAEQVPIFEEIYQKMNAEEIMWLMKVGATERTFLGLWHPDAEALFSVSSSLRRFRLEQQETGITLMQCFQPQLAQFQMTTTWDKLVRNLGVTEEEPEFWIEEKLDGERMQMHMTTDDTVPGGYRFAFWSRKAKDYTYLYGSGLQDDNSALTRHLGNAFDEGVRNLILDGEMVTWDPDVDKMVPFGTLKTAALDQQKNPFQTGPRPLYRVFDILLLNDKCLTEYTLADRRKALERAVKGEPRRLEIHTYETATSAAAIEPMLRKVVAEASEGLVLKNPRSRYQLNSRNNDWIKVKPEYMSEFGESLDCVVIGGYFGSGRRGGTLSSFLCGLRVSQNYIKAGANPEKCLSVCKVGGGFKAEDYAEIKHHTEGKWRDWDSANPPSYFIELGGGERLQYEKPDVWIRPKDSIVLEIKAASISPSDQFAMGWTLRFPRFKRLRLDKAWDAGLDIDEFEALKNKVNQDVEERKAMEMESRKRRPTKRAKQGIVIAGTTRDVTTDEAAELLSFAPPSSSKGVFDGLDFCVLSESTKPLKMSKPDLERLIKEHGGRIHQQVEKGSSTIAVADKNVVKVASLKKQGDVDIVRPRWVFDCLAQDGRRGYLLPFEQVHLLHGTEMTTEKAAENMDQFGDSYFRDVNPEELAGIFDKMPMGADLNLYPEEEEENRGGFDAFKFLDQLEDHGRGLDDLQSFLFRRCIVYFSTSPGVSKTKTLRLANYVRFGGGFVFDVLTDDDEHEDDVYDVTHVVVVAKDDASEREQAAHLRERLCFRERMPRIVTQRWVEACWREKTLLDEERFTPA